MSPIRLFLILILLCSIYGFPTKSRLKNKIHEIFNAKSKDYDNRYVWFTRNIHDDNNNPDDYELDSEHFHTKKLSVKKQKLYPT